MAKVWKAFKAYAKGRYHLILWSVWFVLLIEFLSRRSVGETVSWVFLHFPIFILNSGIVLALLLFLTGLTARPRLSIWLLTGIIGALAFVSGVKFAFLGVPLVPSDFTLVGEAQGWVTLQEVLPVSILVVIASLLLCGYLLIHRLKGLAEPFSRKERAIFVIGSCCVLAFSLTYNLFSSASANAGALDQVENVTTNGFPLAMVVTLGHMGASGNGDAGTAVVEALSQQVAVSETSSDSPSVKPNIILVLSESFWDPTRMTGVSFSKDPIPFFHSLQKGYPSGWMLSPEFAGSTANVEFEVLTGLSMQFLPDGVLVYTQYMNRPVDSLASILEREGYHSTVVSPWARDFYNSDGAYHNLGFEEFISQEQMQQVFSGPNIADSEVARNIMEVTASTSGPDFVFANTAENHYAYTRDKFDEYTVKVEGLSPTATEYLETYAEGCLHADRMLQMLVEHYSQVDEPTILVFFGDHLPLLGKEYQVYKEAGYISGLEDPDFLTKMYEVPVVVWSNYQPAEAEDIYIGTNFLGPYILAKAGLPGTPVTEYLAEIAEQIPAIPPQRYWASWGIASSDLVGYQAVQEDILFGNQIVYGKLKSQIASPRW